MRRRKISSCLLLVMAIAMLNGFRANSYSAENLPKQKQGSSSNIGSNSTTLDTLVIERTLEHTSPAEAYRRCLSAWREKNLGLWLLPPPIVWKRGDDVSGIGLVLARVPPAGLLESIIDAKYPLTADDGQEDGQCADDDEYWMEYKVLNPSIITWPVRSHRGYITFHRLKEDTTQLTWKVEWEPMPLLGPLLRFITTRVITCAANFVTSGR